jgi:hypothetical protein
MRRIIDIFYIIIRAILIGFIVYDFKSSLDNGAPISLHLEVLRGTVLVYYLPFSVFSLFLQWFMKNRKLFILTLIFDLIIISFLDTIISLMI